MDTRSLTLRTKDMRSDFSFLKSFILPLYDYTVSFVLFSACCLRRIKSRPATLRSSADTVWGFYSASGRTFCSDSIIRVFTALRSDRYRERERGRRAAPCLKLISPQRQKPTGHRQPHRRFRAGLTTAQTPLTTAAAYNSQSGLSTGNVY